MNLQTVAALALRTVAALASVALALGLAAVAVVLIRSPGKPAPVVSADGRPLPGAISEKGSVAIRGAELGYFIKGANQNAPVLLYLHGGMPDYFLTERYPSGLDSLFVVAWLDLRGAGRSYDPKRDGGEASEADWLADAASFADYLRGRFGKERIYLMGHSGGTYLGVKLIEAYPEAFEAYIGVAQMSDQRLSEKLSYDYIMDRYRDRPDRRRVYEALAAEPVAERGPLPASYLRYRDYAMHDLSVGTMRGMRDIVTGIFIPSLLFTELTLGEKLGLWRAKAASGVSALWRGMTEVDLAKESARFEVPVYFMHGEMDYTVSHPLAKAYFDAIEAPDKAFFSFPNSAHSPIFEEPEACLRILKERVLPAARGSARSGQ
jgi:pimeloyl-ACP methyl ester carboxylesterase